MATSSASLASSAAVSALASNPAASSAPSAIVTAASAARAAASASAIARRAVAWASRLRRAVACSEAAIANWTVSRLIGAQIMGALGAHWLLFRFGAQIMGGLIVIGAHSGLIGGSLGALYRAPAAPSPVS